VPDSISSAKHPVGIVIQHGTSRTTSARLWAYVWSIEPMPDPAPWQRPGPPESPS
jgi:hypothetical protein